MSRVTAGPVLLLKPFNVNIAFRKLILRHTTTMPLIGTVSSNNALTQLYSGSTDAEIWQSVIFPPGSWPQLLQLEAVLRYNRVRGSSLPNNLPQKVRISGAVLLILPPFLATPAVEAPPPLHFLYVYMYCPPSSDDVFGASCCCVCCTNLLSSKRHTNFGSCSVVIICIS